MIDEHIHCLKEINRLQADRDRLRKAIEEALAAGDKEPTFGFALNAIVIRLRAAL